MMAGEESLATKKELVAQLNEVLEDMSVSRLRALLSFLEDKPVKWQRQYERKRCQIAVDYDTDTYSSRKDIRNLSAGGVYLETGESFIPGQEISLWFSRVDDDAQPVKVSGTVVRRDSRGVGVRFEKLDEGQRSMLLGEVRTGPS